MRTARARGVYGRRLLLRHLMRNALIPVVTVAAMEMSNLLAGAVMGGVLYPLSRFSIAISLPAGARRAAGA